MRSDASSPIDAASALHTGSRSPAGDRGQAAQGPILTPVSAAENPLPAPAGTSEPPAAARGRKTLSTAFVMVGPDRQLTVELHNGRVLVLRDVTIGRKEYCGVHVGGAAGTRF